MNLELCTDCVEGAVLAGRYGFQRIELCAALSEGGLTPSYGMIHSCAESTSAEVHAMIRCRGGGFTCDETELLIMQKDIKMASEAGARGVVFGILDPNGDISKKNETLVSWAHSLGLRVTFHRAFDQTNEPIKAMGQLIQMGFDRLLTSGLQNKAIEGLALLRNLQKDYGSEIQIMAGSGVNADNALLFAEAGLEHLHFTARKESAEVVIPGMGQNLVTDESKMQAISELFR